LTTGSSVDLQGGLLAGSGTINANVTNDSEIDVGGAEQTGILTINGDYTQRVGGVLQIKIGGLTPGDEFDQLKITGQATLDGTLAVSLISGFVPNTGDSFSVLTFGSVSGVFAAITGDGPLFDPVYDANSLTLVAT
jgi:hypothetical protein